MFINMNAKIGTENRDLVMRTIIFVNSNSSLIGVINTIIGKSGRINVNDGTSTIRAIVKGGLSVNIDRQKSKLT